MWGSTSPPKPRGTTRTYRVLLLKTGTTTRATSTSDPGTVRAFHEEARAVPLSGESGHTRVIQAHVPERACRFEACLRDAALPHTCGQGGASCHPGSRPGLPHEDTVRTPRTSSDPTAPYPQAGPARRALLPSRGTYLPTRPYRSSLSAPGRPVVSAGDAPPLPHRSGRGH